jgi:integrase
VCQHMDTGTTALTLLALRERALVLLAALTGLRQSEMFGLKWSDIDFAQRNSCVRSCME